jgi:hypothetical protein
MDADRFDALTRALTAAGSRRRALALAVSGMLAPLISLGDTDARKSVKKCKKIDKKKKRKKCLKKARRANPCQDGVKNGNESDIDCGGTCPRCTAGQICNSRDDCTTGLCVAGACAQCVVTADCGLHSDGLQCFCRDTPGGQRFCTEQTCRPFAGDSCANCVAGEECLVAGGGADRECCTPCGAT